MTKTARDTAAATAESFSRHYAAIWGAKRWERSLHAALAQPTRYVALVNRYAPSADATRALSLEGASQAENRENGSHASEPGLVRMSLPGLAGRTKDYEIECFCRALSNDPNSDAAEASESRDDDFPSPQPAASHSARLMTHWNLDGASVLVAHLLDVQPGDSVLDLCAAPGGKSITLAQRSWPEMYADATDEQKNAAASRSISRLVTNETDGRRQKRLAENLQAYLPPKLLASGKAQCTKVDATVAGPATNALLAGGNCDKVLVDAPCSSERHIIHANLKASASHRSAPEMANWRPGTSKTLAKTQVDLLMNALRAVKVGRVVMYATCSIEPTENDGVIEKMLAMVEKMKKKGAIQWTVELGFGSGERSEAVEKELQECWAERTRFGWIVLPDHSSGHRFGPLFFSRITKLEAG